ncbi:MAG: ferritin family protein [Candidatus Nanoarchaeia archaeon]|nr:ferritin family protein [Candidatus Nanoarchaeia archaeon]
MKQTIINLMKAFVGESQARNRYTFFASTAKKEGYEQIAEIFLITADQEREHGGWFYKMLIELKKKEGIKDEEIIVETSGPSLRSSTLENLKNAAKGEHHEYTELYPEFAKVAEEEGFRDVAIRIRAIMKAEEHHEERYKKLIEQLEAGTFFKKEEKIWWICRECGYAHFGKEPPMECPSCGHSKAFYQRKCEEY